MTCHFCRLDPAQHLASNDLAYAVADGFAVSPGHTLIVTRRHVASWFETTADEQQAIMTLLQQLKLELDQQYKPDGYNIGFNVGEAAGQTVMHVHVHVIPRFAGDVDDPTGGVRLVKPDQGNYRRPGFVPRSLGKS